MTRIDPAAPGADGGGEQRIGPYLVRERVGEGGMGVVYVADQLEPVRRRVALKIVKAGLTTEEMLARFEIERQSLALMNHPGIAQIYDAGVTADGRPYFAMEYVPGLPIVDYGNRVRLGVRERVQLLVEVARAVQHAHQKGIIHRDLKPSNVLVAEVDGEHRPKVIDFGVAKTIAAIGQNPGSAAYTEFGRIVGTPQYMSPEQADLNALGIDTRSDVYSLGVVAYELLTGSLPFDVDALLRKGYGELQRVIRDESPPTPSTRVTKLGESAAADIATQRCVDPQGLARSLRGELDWIVMRALEKEPARRYQTAAELAADLGRYLRNEPVLASPPSRVYRLRKAVARHQLAFALGVSVVVLLVAFAITSSLQAMRIADEAERANAAATKARAAADTAGQVQAFLVDLFRVADPDKSRGDAITAREILDAGAERIRTELADQPRVQGELLRTIGGVYGNLGLYDEASKLLEQAVGVLEDACGADSAELASALENFGRVLRQRGRYDEARAVLERALAIVEPLGEETHRTTAALMNAIGSLSIDTGKNRERALEWHERALEVQERHLAPNDLAFEITLNNIAVAHYYGGDQERAAEYFERAMAVFEAQDGPLPPSAAYLLNNLGNLYASMDQLADARAKLEQALELAAAFDENHEVIGAACEQLGRILPKLDASAEDVERVLQRAVVLRERIYGLEHPVCGRSKLQLGEFLLGRERFDDARAQIDGAVAAFDAYFGADEDPRIAYALWVRARLDLAAGASGASTDEDLVRARRILETHPEAEGEQLARVLETTAVYREAAGERDLATKLRARATELREASAKRDG